MVRTNFYKHSVALPKFAQYWLLRRTDNTEWDT